MEIGYFLASEEHGPNALVDQAKMAAGAGMTSVWIADHFHPWIDEQGQSPFVWSVIGGIAATTELTVTTAVTCPILRIHPVIIAQAAATSALMLDGRFELGIGTGENLNEHVIGEGWPPPDLRLAMLEESVEIMRELWSGDETTFRGDFYTVESARIYSNPDTPPPVVISAFGPKAVQLAADIADGYVTTSPDAELVAKYRDLGGAGEAQAGMKVCWAADRDEAVATAHRLWPTSGLPGQLSQELRTPDVFEGAVADVTPEQLAERIVCGPDVEAMVAMVKKYADAGIDRLYVGQIGQDQAGFFEFFTNELEPALAEIDVHTGSAS